MPWKIISRALGMQEGSPVRAVFDQILGAFGFDGTKPGTTARTSVAFTIAVVTLAAKMSKADGISSDIEVAAFERLFHVPEGDRAGLRRVFDLARQDVAGYESYARKIAALLEHEPDLKISVLECLLYMATADGVHHPAEETFLSTVADLVGVARTDYLTLRRAFVHDPESPYLVLGLSPSASEAEIKSRYRELAREHHPDLLIAKGVPEEFLAASGRRLAAINDAYAAILAERGREPGRTGPPLEQAR